VGATLLFAVGCALGDDWIDLRVSVGRLPNIVVSFGQFSADLGAALRRELAEKWAQLKELLNSLPVTGVDNSSPAAAAPPSTFGVSGLRAGAAEPKPVKLGGIWGWFATEGSEYVFTVPCGAIVVDGDKSKAYKCTSVRVKRADDKTNFQLVLYGGPKGDVHLAGYWKQHWSLTAQTGMLCIEDREYQRVEVTRG
jgi:hypothetical protein